MATGSGVRRDELAARAGPPAPPNWSSGIGRRMVTLEGATAGQELVRAGFALSGKGAKRYLEAVEDSNARPAESLGIAPPMALAAASFRLLIEAVRLPAGTMHLAQQLQFRGAIPIGAPLEARARVAQRLGRGGGLAIAVDHSVLTEGGDVCLSGRALLLLPSGASGPVEAPGSRGSFDGLRTSGAEMASEGQAGDEQAASLVRQITIEKISRYARASGDFNPVHLDESFARGTPFGGIVAHGMMLLGYIGSLMEGAFGGGWREGGGMDVRLRAPARPGDLVEIRSVLQETPTEARGAIAECQVACVNQRGEVLVAGRAWARSRVEGAGWRVQG